MLRASEREAVLIDLAAQSIIQSWNDPLHALGWLSASFQSTPGRWVGYLNYDLAYLFESIGSVATDDLRTPPFAFAFVPRGTRSSAARTFAPALIGNAQPVSTFTRESYEHAVERVRQYIAAGDVFQINLSQRFTVATDLSATQIHQRFIADSPAAYGALLDFGNFALVSNSPELFLHVQPVSNGDRRIVTRPIKGTRPLTAGMEEELRYSVKDQAELNMIVDLERNDLGRICRIGSVRVTEPRAIEAHPTVYHGVATIEGMLKSEINFLDILAATFPGGSVTGAPKIRAMQLIDQLEPTRRGPYCGAIGYIDSDGSMQFNLAIRTIILKDREAHISVGGGIVADSVPAAEYEETLVKARAMFRAVGIERESADTEGQRRKK